MKFKKLYILIVFFKFCLISFAQDVFLCEGDTLRFNSTASNPSNFLEWEFVLDNGSEIISGQNTESILVKFDNPGDYILQFREFALSDCYSLVEQTVKVQPNPLAAFTNGSICIYDSVKFFNNSSAIDGLQSSIWRVGDLVYNDLNLTYSFDETGEYLIELTVVSNNGCFDKDALSFKLSDKPIANFYFTPEHPSSLEPEVYFSNLSFNSDSVLWDFGDNNFSSEWEPSHTFDSIGWYTVELSVADENGCTDTVSKNLLVENDVIFYFPNSFTPDDNGLNDGFGIQGFKMDKYQSYFFEITNRWGQVLFSTDNVSDFWYGKTNNGNNAISGNYIWSVILTDKLGNVTRSYGEFKLIR